MNRKIVVLVVAVVLVIIGLVSFRLIADRQFRISKTTPTTDNFPNSSDKIEIFFNKTLGQNNKDQVSVTGSGASVSDISFNEKGLVVRFKTLPQTGTVNVRLKDIRSSAGEVLSKTLILNVKYVDFAELPEDQKKAQIEESDSFESNYQVIKNLPLETEFYSIDYKFPSGGETRMPVTITLKFNAELDPSTGRVSNQTRQDYINKVRTYRNEAIGLLTEFGYKSADYDLIFPEPELASEFAQY